MKSLWMRLFWLAPDEGAGAGGAPTTTGAGSTTVEPAKTFTQAELDAIVAGRLAKERKGWEARVAELEPLKAQVARIAELEQQLQEHELRGKSAEEKARIAADQAAKRIAEREQQLTKERDEQKARADKAEEDRRADRVRAALTDALVKAKAYPEAIDDAVGAFAAATTDLEFDERAQLVSLTYGGLLYKRADLAKAAEAFLKTKPYFAAATGGGAGTPRPNGGGAPPADPFSLPLSERLKIGLKLADDKR